MTVVGPLTTTFQAPSSCTTQLYQVFSESESSYVQGPLFTSGSDCFPSGYDPEPANYYSPGVCPHGHTVACSSLASVSTETETAVACCPTYVRFPSPAGGRIEALTSGVTQRSELQLPSAHGNFTRRLSADCTRMHNYMDSRRGRTARCGGRYRWHGRQHNDDIRNSRRNHSLRRPHPLQIR
jgi:hypothetical protein